MKGKVEVFYNCDNTGEKTLLASEDNIILTGASQSFAEVLVGNIFGPSDVHASANMTVSSAATMEEGNAIVLSSTMGVTLSAIASSIPGSGASAVTENVSFFNIVSGHATSSQIITASNIAAAVSANVHYATIHNGNTSSLTIIQKTAGASGNTAVHVSGAKDGASGISLVGSGFMSGTSPGVDTSTNILGQNNANYEASNYTIAAISFGKGEKTFSGTSGNAHTFDPDGLEATSSILTCSNALFAIIPLELSHKNNNYYPASAEPPPKRLEYDATGLMNTSRTGPEVEQNIERSKFSVLSGVSGILDTTGIALSAVSAGVSSAFEELVKRDAGHNKGVGFAPWYFLSYISGIDPTRGNVIGPWNTTAPRDRIGNQNVAEHAYFELKKAGGGTSASSVACDQAVSALLRISSKVGCSVPSGGEVSAMVFPSQKEITTGDSAAYGEGVTSPYTAGLSSVPTVDKERNRDMAGFIRHIQASGTGFKTSGLVTSGVQITSGAPIVTYLYNIPSTDMIASNLYGGIYNMGLWTINRKTTETRSRDKFYYLRNPVKYRLFAMKHFSDNLLGGVPNTFTGSLDIIWTITFNPRRG